MNELKVSRLDSPLLRRSDSPTRADDAAAPEGEAAPTASRPARARRSSTQRTATRNGTRPRRSAVAPASPAPPPEVVQRPDPPPPDEALTLLSARLPESLRVRLTGFTVALRAREGGGYVSQKALPEQEVLALAVWALGDPDDPSAVEALVRVRSDWHARRHAAAARNFEAAARS